MKTDMIMRNRHRKYEVQLHEREAMDKLAKRREEISLNIKQNYNDRKIEHS